MENVAAKELNTFLKGLYMGIHAYDHYIANAKDPFLRQQLQQIQQEHKKSAIRVAERIQNLGAMPVDDVGLTGAVAETMQQITGYPQTKAEIVKSALKGEEDYGIEMTEKIVRGDLDPQSRKMVEEVLDVGRRHVDDLKRLQH